MDSSKIIISLEFSAEITLKREQEIKLYIIIIVLLLLVEKKTIAVLVFEIFLLHELYTFGRNSLELTINSTIYIITVTFGTFP